MTADVVIEGRGLSREFSFGEEKVTALHTMDIDILAGSMTAIVGKSGSGKTTLCNLLSGVDRPTTGTVRLLGHDLRSLGDAAMSRLRANRIGFVLQKDNLVPWLTIEENVAAPLIFGGMKRKAALARAAEYLELTGLSHRAKSWPSLVSGGEAQRAAVARACVGEPAVVFADEPTGALDRQNGDRVKELFWSLIRERKTAGVLITHDMDLADDADVVLHISDGRLVGEDQSTRG
ncbi:MAG: ABC transporter ATP-binding protein [Gordonia sp. (in: high G+C Gram-positive bacteria)]|uniref:ABC transporter ATP-binding protein n=1 Tax=Gordonia sp. (in: high G+C Gram-positive bacteria) TaxID=84139 RepID=UPI003BB78D61